MCCTLEGKLASHDNFILPSLTPHRTREGLVIGLTKGGLLIGDMKCQCDSQCAEAWREHEASCRRNVCDTSVCERERVDQGILTWVVV